MDPESRPLLRLTVAERDAVARKWLALVFASYPGETARFLDRTRDPFRNPVGEIYRRGLPVLVEQVAGGFDLERIEAVLDEILHLRAVQGLSPSEAVGFVFQLNDALRAAVEVESPALEAVRDRVERMAALAFDVYMRCREKLWAIRYQDLKRRFFVTERMAARSRGSR